MLLALTFRNALRHRLRTGLTTLGIVVAVLAFGLLSTVVDAWYAGSEAASSARLVTRNAVSLVIPLPVNYRARILGVDGVRRVAAANWFGGVYIAERNFFPQFAVQATDYFPLYPEYRIPEEQWKDFLHDRKGAVVGRKLADTWGWKLGDVVPLRGTIYPGSWEFVVRAIYDGADAKTDTSQFFLHWDYLNERVKQVLPSRANAVGVYVIGIDEPDRAAEISLAVDAEFRNSLAETLTETEKAFQLGFVSMVETIVVAVRVVSFLVIFIIMAVMANTMAMTARERLPEYATLKALGFRPRHVALLVFTESMAIAMAGGALGIALTFPAAAWFASVVGSILPVFVVEARTVALQAGCAVVVGAVAALVPALTSARVRVVDGLRAVA